MIYTLEMRKAVHSIQKPPGFACDIIDKDDHIALRVYEDDIHNLSFTQRLKAMEYLTQVEDIVKTFGVQCYSEGAKGARPRI